MGGGGGGIHLHFLAISGRLSKALTQEIASQLLNSDESSCSTGRWSDFNAYSATVRFQNDWTSTVAYEIRENYRKFLIDVRCWNNSPRVNRLCGDTRSYVCPQIWLNEARANIGLSPAKGFLNENDSSAYFAIFGRIVVRYVFYCGLFQDFKFSLIVSWRFQ